MVEMSRLVDVTPSERVSQSLIRRTRRLVHLTMPMRVNCVASITWMTPIAVGDGAQRKVPNTKANQAMLLTSASRS